MRTIIGVILLLVVAIGIFSSLSEIPFGSPKTKVGRHYVEHGLDDTGAANIVTSVVVSYRGFDTLGEVTVLFIAATGLAAVVRMGKRKAGARERASFVLNTGCMVLFPLILVYGSYIFIHGHLTPGGGFQGGAIIASAFLLSYLGCRESRIKEKVSATVESLGGLVFVVVGLIGLGVAGYFLYNFLPQGSPYRLLSSGIIPVIYVAIGFKVGSELAGIIDNLIEETG
jgi:multicomponent Na+:H+ antiporter subunit B